MTISAIFLPYVVSNWNDPHILYVVSIGNIIYIAFQTDWKKSQIGKYILYCEYFGQMMLYSDYVLHISKLLFQIGL